MQMGAVGAIEHAAVAPTMQLRSDPRKVQAGRVLTREPLHARVERS